MEEIKRENYGVAVGGCAVLMFDRRRCVDAKSPSKQKPEKREDERRLKAHVTRELGPNGLNLRG